MTDPIADLLTRMRNAFNAKREQVVTPYSKVNVAIVETLKKSGFIKDYRKIKEGSFDRIEITFDRERPTLNLKRVSKPGQRIYIGKLEITPVLNNYGISVLSTSKGIMTGREAYKAGIGGEYICQAW